MADSGAKTKRQIPWGAVTILAAAAIAFVLAVWFRISLSPGPTPLERLIAERAPAENVQALALTADGHLLVGTSLGLIEENGGKWRRLPGPEVNAASIARAPDGAFLLAGRGTGVVLYRDGTQQPLLSGDAEAVVVMAEGMLLAMTDGHTLQASRDAGKNWTRLADFGTEQMLALATDGRLLAAGGLQGTITVSADGGKTWETRPAPGGSVTALLFDPSKAGRLWTSAGGAVYYSDDDGYSWRRGQRKVANRPVVALAPGSAGAIRGVTADGLIVEISVQK